MSKPQRRDPAKERFWRRMLRLWRPSGLTGRDFCAQHGLAEGSFYAWRREIARRDQCPVRDHRAQAMAPDQDQRGQRPTPRPPHQAKHVPPPHRTQRVPPARAAATRATGSAFVQVTVDPAAAPERSAVPAPLEVVVGPGRLVRVRAGFDADVLRQLVRLLEEPTC